MIRRPPRSTQSRSSAASDVYKRQLTTTTKRRYFGVSTKAFVLSGSASGACVMNAAENATSYLPRYQGQCTHIYSDICQYRPPNIVILQLSRPIPPCEFLL